MGVRSYDAKALAKMIANESVNENDDAQWMPTEAPAVAYDEWESVHRISQSCNSHLAKSA